MMGGGLCWLDYNSDGWLDLFVVNSLRPADTRQWEEKSGLPRSALFPNVGGTFEDVSRRSARICRYVGNGLRRADFDLDSHTDLYVTTAVQRADGPTTRCFGTTATGRSPRAHGAGIGAPG